ncbi:MAG TPA: diguanylate cyclase, partial [Clostridiales bacterium]|nr:diguanylate cyclase [Clostridiales bacterium]
AAEIAERMRNSIQNKTFIYEGKRFRITASFGICTFSGNACITIEDFIESADKKLYDAKKEGRNRVKF